MATEQKSENMQQQSGRMDGDVGSPISNDAYNVIACLHEKLQGLEAMRKFSKDADQQIWKQIGQLDMQAVDVLLSRLEKLVQEGKLRSGVSSQGQRPAARS